MACDINTLPGINDIPILFTKLTGPSQASTVAFSASWSVLPNGANKEGSSPVRDECPSPQLLEPLLLVSLPHLELSELGHRRYLQGQLYQMVLPKQME